MKFNGMCPGMVTLHVRCGVSLLINMAQLYSNVSPGQSMSFLLVFLSVSDRLTDAGGME